LETHEKKGGVRFFNGEKKAQGGRRKCGEGKRKISIEPNGM